MTSTQKLSSMTDAELKSFLFADHSGKGGFAQETAEFMQAIIQQESLSAQNASKSLRAETDIQDAFTKMTQDLSDKYAQQVQEANDMTSSMPSWLSDVVSGFMVLASIITLNPCIIGMSAVAFTLQVSGLQDKMMKAACGDDPNKQAAFSFGFALGEAIACGGVSMAGDSAAMSKAIESGTEVVAKTASEKALAFAKYTFSYLGQGLMMDNFWPEFFQGPCKMSEQDAAMAGLFVGMAVGIGSGVAAGANEDGFTQMLRDKMNNLSDKTRAIFHNLTTALHLMGDGFQLGQGIEQVKIGQQFKELADFEKNQMAPTMKEFSLMQSLTTGMQGMLSQTEDELQMITDSGAAESQTFSSFADMFKG